MGTVSRKGFHAALLAMLGSLAWSSSPARADDELRKHACALRLDFASFRGVILRMLRDKVPDLFEDHGPFELRLRSPQITSRLGQLAYDASGRPTTNPSGTNDSNTSNDDYIRVRIPIEVHHDVLGKLTTFFVDLGVAFPQSPPPHLQNGGSRSCNCRTVRDARIGVIHELRRCDPENQYDITVCQYLPTTNVLRTGENFVDGNAHPIGGLWYDLFALYPERPVPESALPGAPDGCSFTQFRPCQDLLGLDGFDEADFSDAQNNICHLCHRVYHNEETVTVNEDILPGPLAVYFRIENNPQDLCDLWNHSAGFVDGFQFVIAPVVNAITFGGLLMLIPEVEEKLRYAFPGSIPGCPIEMDVLLGAAGYAEYDYTPLWWDAEYDPSFYTTSMDLFWNPAAGQVSHNEDTCCLQQALDDGIGTMFRAEHEVTGYGSVTLQDIIKAGGGIRISEHKEALFLLAPPTWTKPEDLWGSNCTDGYSQSELMQTGIDLQTYLFVLGQRVDIPGAISRALADDPDSAAIGVSVTCNHGRDCAQVGAVDLNGDGHCDCEERGLADQDRDGFCDTEPDGTEDRCPWAVTGMNCDSDRDGYGDAMRQMVDNCIINDDIQVQGEAREQLRHRLCGGCDNCPSVPNREVHTPDKPGFYDALSPQVDRDSDGIGDACDEDADGDGIHREWDCDDLNPGIAHDRDGDGVCDPLSQSPTTDPWARIPCLLACQENGISYYPSEFDLVSCMDRCAITDNAFDRGLAFCQHVEQCSTTAAAARPETCPSQHCRFTAGPGFPISYVGNRCIPLQKKQCARAWANADQKDSDADGVGDRMDPTPRVRDIFFGRGSPGLFLNSCSDHMVGIGTTGGETYADPTVVDQHGYHVPQFTKVYRDGVNLGACMCDLPLQGGEWGLSCWNESRCPGTTEKQFVSPGVFRRTWNPLNAPQTVDGLYTPNPSYPVAEGLLPGEIRTHVEQDALMYARKVGFSQDLGPGGSHHLDWHADKSVEFYTWSLVDWPAQRDMDRTKIRVAWPPFSLIDFDNLSSSFMAFSQSGPTAGDCGLFGARAGLLDLAPGTGPAPPRIPPEVVVSVIPGIAEPELARDSVLRPRVGRPGYFIGKDPQTGAISLNALGSDTPRVVARWELQDDGLLDRPELLRGTAATLTAEIAGLQPSSTEAVFLYRPASPGDTGCDNLSCTGFEPARFYISTETAQEPMELVSGEDLWGQQSPDLFDARVIHAQKEHAVLLIGRGGATTAVDQAWRLDLGTGSWEGPFTLGLPYPLSGYAFRYDPVSRKVLAFGGASVVGDAILSAEVHSICPRTLQARRMATLDPPPAALLARASAGSYLDASERALYVYGGNWDSGPVTHKDVWRLDLQSRQWSLVHESDLAEAPDPVVEPFLYFNRHRSTVWVGDLLGRNTAEGLRLHALGPDGVWHALPAIQLPEAQTWPVQATYTPGSRPSYPWITPECTSLPGALALATLQAAQPFLGVKVFSGEAELLGESVAGPMGEQVAGFLCPVGDTCTLEVGLLPRGGSAAWLPFTLSVAPADLALESEHPQAGPIAGLALRHDRLYVASAGRLQTYSLGDLLEPRGRLSGSAVAAAQALVPCAGYLCLAHPSLRGLTVIDLANPDHPKVAHRTFTAGLGWDVAASGRRVFLAHGLFGVGVYTLDGRGQPTYQRTLWAGGIVRSVAANKRLLAAAQLGGTVKIYRNDDTIVASGEIRARGKIDRVRFLGGYLWVRGKTGAWAEVWNVRDPAAPTLLGEVTGGGMALMEALFHGDRAFGFAQDNVQIYRVQPTL